MIEKKWRRRRKRPLGTSFRRCFPLVSKLIERTERYILYLLIRSIFCILKGSKSAAEQETSHNQPRHSHEQTPIVIVDNQERTEDVEMQRRKSVESLASQINDTEIEQTSQRKSLESPVGLQRSKSFEQMDVDEFDHDESSNDNNDDNLHESATTVISRRPSQRTSPLINKSVAKSYVTKEDFDYTMNLFDIKINSIYKLCKHIGEKQNENTKALKRLVALDELSDGFWNVSNLAHLAVLFRSSV